MAALQIRDVPEDLHRLLTQQAEEKGVSLQKYLLELLEDSTRLSRQRRAIQEMIDNGPSLNISTEEIVEGIHEDRREREEHLGQFGN